MARRKATNAPYALSPEEAAKTIGKGLSFDAAEAYKLLRTNLAFSFPDSDGSKVIGVTSALRGEAKSTTSINLAYTLAETGKRVLLMEGDMRLPVLSKRLKLRKAPGLSDLLAGQSSGNEVLQNSGMLNNLKVIVAGTVPPNPAELLDSRPMQITLETMREYFDYVIVDLPPVMAVSDALVLSKFLDGIVVVVRQNCCDKKSLDETVRQLRFSKAKILGFVVADSNQQKKKYKHKYYSKEYHGSAE
ncbi:MAG: CpsD/CapB family tyrosine-protein kinase [Faecousia sp.]